ncbi:MAG: VOC family protein [Gammaproteobacteria bacterium]
MPPVIDHLVYGVADLGAGMDLFGDLLGTHPVIGGRHSACGTHNALLSLGPGVYLEIIAADPDQALPERGVLFGLDTLEEPRLITWVLRVQHMDRLARRATAADVGLGPVQTGARRNPDGSRLTWRVTDPYAMPMGGAVPFLIDWGETPHPSGSAPHAGSLVSLRIEHPEAGLLRRRLHALGVGIDVTRAASIRLTATIDSGHGRVELA